MSARHDNTDGPEDIDAAFAEIVAGLEEDDELSRLLHDEDPETQDQRSDPETTPPPPTGQPDARRDGPRDWSPSGDTEDEGHFEPPEPPPLPIPSPATLGGIALMGLGVILLLMPGLLGLTSTIALPLGLVLISSGIGWLLLRLRHTPPDAGGDDGAQL